MPQAMRYVKVVWEDAMHTFGWQDGERPDEGAALEVTSVGHLARKTRKEVALVMSLGGGVHAQTLTIPRGMVRSITELVPDEKPAGTRKSRSPVLPKRADQD